MKKMTKNKITDIEILVGANIKLRRVMLGLSLDEIKDHLGVSLQQLGKYENGKNRVSAGKLFIFSEILKVPIDYFFTQNEESRILINDSKSFQYLIKAFRSIKSPEERNSILSLTKIMAEKA